MNSFRLKDIQPTDPTGEPLDKELSEKRVRQSVLSILGANVLFSISTVTPDDRAHINTAYFSYSDSLELYFLSHPGSLHCRNLSRNASMAASIFSSLQQWTDPGQGLQLFGACAVTSGATAEEAERVYQRRFPAYQDWKASLKTEDLAREYRFYRFDVASIKVLDERNLGDALFVVASVIRE
jgi:uncharacterized protein YhbP (UPF0306 family)